MANEYVALLAEGVDRNSIEETLTRNPKRSPSSRRAWIEICDRFARSRSSLTSPSSRRAWIEISKGDAPNEEHHVALLAEGVDRNELRASIDNIT